MDSRFRALFETHHVALLRLLHARGVDANEVEDVALEIWKDIHRKLPDEAPRFDAVRDEDRGGQMVGLLVQYDFRLEGGWEHFLAVPRLSHGLLRLFGR